MVIKRDRKGTGAGSDADAAIQRQASGGAPGKQALVEAQGGGAGSPLPHALQHKFESSLGADLQAWAARPNNGGAELAEGDYQLRATYEVESAEPLWAGKLAAGPTTVHVAARPK